uniref:Endothelin-converting enzyme 1 n=1 Tax=Phallusia mammillata TaxID=59560 RepID=A0A6F9DC41_9ASCI|nr:endothelin-converting enzyme 1 [Phallusia mammillata]
MNRENVKYAVLSQSEVTSTHEDGSGGRNVKVSTGDGELPDIDQDSPVLDTENDELHFHNYKRSSYCCHWQRIRCRRFSRSFTTRELFLCLMTAFLAVIVVILLAYQGARAKDNTPQCPAPAASHVIGDQPCMTRSCIEVASRISLSLDESVNPCDDFYEFSCGGWVKRNPLPAGHSRWGTFNELWQRNQVILKSVLESNNTEETSEAELKAKQYYKSCLNMEAINKVGPKPLMDLMEKMGGWAVWESWNETNFDFNQTLMLLSPYSIYPFFNIAVGTDSKHSNSNIIMVSESSLGLGTRDFYMNKTVEDDKIMAAYFEYMTEVGTLLGGKKNHTREQMLEVIELETEIAAVTLPLEDMRDEEKNYQRFTLQELQTLAPAVDWQTLIDRMFREHGNISIEPNEPMITNSLDYIKKFSTIVNKTPKRVLSNYAMWRFIQLFVNVLNQPFIDAWNKLHKVKFGSDLTCWERWIDCVGAVDDSLGLALSRMFIHHNFDKTSKKSAEEMVKDIKAAFNRSLKQVEWMDAHTKVRAAEKAEAVEDMIGFPDNILNVTYVDQEYVELNITSNQTYFEQQQNFIKYINIRQIKELRCPVERNEWSMTPPTVNAYYSPTKNVIVFPAGILQPPFYNNHYPLSINFGGIGIVVGHELTHGFDDQGRQYDLHGNLRNWWEQSTLDHFKKKAKCMVDQYAQFTMGGTNLNGNLTIGENIADNGGLQLAFDAYTKRKNGNASDPVFDPLLPALNYTQDQLFFIAFAQLWCTVSTPEFQQQMILTNVHSPGKFRVVGTLANSPQFAEAFQCPVGSPMNPPQKCNVW